MPGKTEIIDAVSTRTGLRKAEVSRVLDETLSEIRSSLDTGEGVSLRGFGNFKVTETAARKGRNPQTGEEIDIPAGRRVGFKLSK